MRFSDIPITGYRIEVDEYALGRFVLEKFLERFGPEQILGADTNGGLRSKLLNEVNRKAKPSVSEANHKAKPLVNEVNHKAKPLVNEVNIFRWWICRYYHSQGRDETVAGLRRPIRRRIV